MLYPSPYIRLVSDADGAAVLNIHRGSILRLNTTGHYVLVCLQRQQDPDRIIQDLAAQTGEDTAVVRRDVLAFIEQLRDHGLIEFREVACGAV